MPEVYYSPKIGPSRSWHDVLLVMLLMIRAGMISTVALGIGTPRHVCRIFRKPAAVHHLRDMLQSDEQCGVAGSRRAEWTVAYTSRAFLQYVVSILTYCGTIQNRSRATR